MDEVVVVEALRTPTGRFGGSFQEVSAVELAKQIIQAVLERSNVEASAVDEVIMGMVYQGGAGANPARQASLAAGLPYETPAMTVNKLCGSGLKSVALAAQALRANEMDVAIAGGMENMSQTPYVLHGARWGERLGHGKIEDMMLLDGLWDCFYDCHMGITAENLAAQYQIGRNEQDAFALRSQERWARAQQAGAFAAEIVPVTIVTRSGESECAVDEHARPDTTIEKLASLKAAFQKDGTVTAGNASGINDGAAALLLMREGDARAAGLKPLAYMRAATSAGVDPKIMGIGPAPAIRSLLEKADIALDAVERIELNEAFAAQSLAVGRELDWDWERVNVNGGAIAMGHAVGASGARVATTLLHELKRAEAQYGIAALCIGGGMGIAALFERYE